MPYSAVPQPDQPSQIHITLPLLLDLARRLVPFIANCLPFTLWHMQRTVTKFRLPRDRVRLHV